MHKANLDPKEVVALYKQGYFVSNIAIMLHTSKPRIKKILADEGIEVSNAGLRRDVSEEELEMMVKEYNDGTNMEALAKKYHVRIKKLRKLFKEHGVVINKWRNHVKKEKVKIERPVKPKYDGPYKVCPYCGWKTKDIENKSHAYGIHLRHHHNLDLKEHLRQYPEDESYLADMVARREGKVQCKICGEWRCLIDNRHLAKHGMTILDYLKKYPNEQVVSDRTHQKLHDCAIKTNAEMVLPTISSDEKEMADLIQGLGFECCRDRTVLNGQELDLYIKEHNIAFEYNGLVWHSEEYGKGEKYHLDKLEKCKQKHIKLVQIFEDEYFTNKPVILSRIRHLLQCDDSKISGKECIINKLSDDIAVQFIEQNSYAPEIRSNIYMGAIYSGEVIALMGFSNKNDNEWICDAYVPLCGKILRGVASKIFKTFIRNYQCVAIYAYADRRWVDDDSKLFKALDFKVNKIIGPQAEYFNSWIDKHRRFTATERQNCPYKDKGKWLKIWNCGAIEYKWSQETN